MEDQESKTTTSGEGNILIVEPFYGGSHRQLVDCLVSEVPGCLAFTLPAKKWHWRARTSAIYFADAIPKYHSGKVLFCSSVLNLAELVALRPDLSVLNKVIYFHENQLVYPVRKHQDRDFQYGYNQILSCLVADVVIFNSKYNMDSFLGSIEKFLKLIPDHRPHGIGKKIAPKCRVVFFPLKLPPINLHSHAGGIARTNDVTGHWHDERLGKLQEKHAQVLSNVTGTHLPCSASDDGNAAVKDNCLSVGECGREAACQHNPDKNEPLQHVNFKHAEQNCIGYPGMTCIISSENSPLHIVWPHRWEHDKDPDAFFRALYTLHDEGLQFLVSVLGEAFSDVPDVFSEAKEQLRKHIVHWGYQASKQDYYETLARADVVISTAKHEFFGVAMFVPHHGSLCNNELVCFFVRLEAVHFGCYPICPNDLVYPEIFPDECLFNTPNQLVKKLRQFCKRPNVPRLRKPIVNLDKFSWETLSPVYQELLLSSNNHDNQGNTS